jgi:hypothetical protein
MTHDTGFAPNPFGGIISLATCKPKIRECKTVGDWIAGFTSKQLDGSSIGNEKLVYLMQTTDKILFKEYWQNKKFIKRKPQPNSNLAVKKCGDNIYIPIIKNPSTVSHFNLLANLHHKEEHKAKDLNGKFVLISNKFYYFGSKPINIPVKIRPNVPKGQSSHGVRTYDTDRAIKFIAFIESNYQPGIYSHPHSWFNDDESWKSDENYIKP